MFRLLLITVILAGLVGIIVTAPVSCHPFVPSTPTPGSHGFRTWYSSVLMSTITEGERVCVPEGWTPLGAHTTGNGWAVFLPEETAVIIRQDAFTTEALTFEQSSYHVTLVTERDLADETRAVYVSMVRAAFENVGSLFPNKESRAHTVMVTANLGYVEGEAGSIYPDPNALVTYLILPPEDPRSEELLLHAVMHLYNRFDERTALNGDLQEGEASWAETAFRSSDVGRRTRFDQLYHAHETHTNGTGIVTNEEMSHEDVQYAHYVLGPLVLIGIDGLLPSHINVRSLLTYLHAHPTEEFEDLLKIHLSPSELTSVHSWMSGNAKIPREILLAGLTRYK